MRLFFLLLTDQLWELNQLIKRHLECHETEALLHIADVLGGELLAEADLGKDVLDVGLDGNVLVNHGDLLGIEGKLPLIDGHSAPELLHFPFDA